MSLADEGTIAQSAGPARTLSAKSDSLSVTLFFLPAMIHLPSARDTTTAGAPHSSRGSRCANDNAWQANVKTAILIISRDNGILPPPVRSTAFRRMSSVNKPIRLKAVLRAFSFANDQPGRTRRQIFDLYFAFAPAQVFAAPEIGDAALTRQRD